MTDVAGVAEEPFIIALRRIEDAWRRGFVGSITLHMSDTGDIKLETREFEKLGAERRTKQLPRDGEERLKP